MEETMGKRIAGNRRRLGLTQEQLAEKLGVTAQAVSKWENDQSCPDISMLPSLAEIFGVTTDEMLGVERRAPEAAVQEAEVVTEPEGDCPRAPDDSGHWDFEYQDGRWNFHYDGRRRSGLGLGIWVLLTGVLLLINPGGAGLWELLWQSALLVFGLFGLYPKFSFFRLGCALFGGYFLLDNFFSFSLGRELLLPAYLVLFGVFLLVDTLKRPKHGRHFTFNNVQNAASSAGSALTLTDDGFSCETCFGSNNYLVQVPCLRSGHASVSFGELHLDLRGCEEFAQDCVLDLDCSFGEMQLLVPRSCQVKVLEKTAFASIDVEGSPAPDAKVTIRAKCDVSFGELRIIYV